MQKKILIITFSFIGGLVAGGLFLFVLGYLPFSFDAPVLRAFGVIKPQIVGFLPYWLLDKADKEYSRYITTLTYFGLTLNDDGSIKKLTNPREEEPGWTTLKSEKYKKRLSDAQTHYEKNSLLVISGDDEIIGTMITHPRESANTLIHDIAPIMKENRFTDLNLDIESFMDASESARVNFTEFVKTVAEKVKVEKLGTVTLDLIPISLVKTKLYDARALGALVDTIVLMTYDYHYAGSFVTGANAPIGGAGISIEYDVETAVKEALKVIPKEKILLGIPLYGYQWETLRESQGDVTIPGGSSTASVRRVAGFLAGCATCSAQWDPIAKAPFVIYPENDYFNQIYFENEQSMKEKITLAGRYHLGGVALWALGYEDANLLGPLTDYKNSLDLSGLQ